MKGNRDNRSVRKIRYQLTGWILFVLCALFFAASSLKNQDTLAFIGSVVFLVACIVFLIPLVQPAIGADRDRNGSGPDLS